MILWHRSCEDIGMKMIKEEMFKLIKAGIKER